MARVLDEDDLIGNWTLVGDELDQLSGRRGPTKLGFTLLLRFYAVHGRFPTGPSEIPDRLRRIIGSGLRQAEQALTARICSRIPPEAVARMLAMIAKTADPGDEEEPARQDDGALFDAAEVAGVDVFAAIREEPGNVSVKTIEREVFKLNAIRKVALPDDLFADVAPTLRAGRARPR